MCHEEKGAGMLGSLEIGGTGTVARGETSYVGFHSPINKAQNANVRLVNDGDGRLTVGASTLALEGDLRLDGGKVLSAAGRLYITGGTAPESSWGTSRRTLLGAGVLRAIGGSCTVAALAVGCMVLTPTAANAAAGRGIRCGEVLLADAQLDRDLHCGGGAGLVLADGVTLDLGGHVLSGAGKTGVGVTLPAAGKSRIQNGKISGWAKGTVAAAPYDGPHTLQLSNVTYAGNATGIDLIGVDANISDCVFLRNGQGMTDTNRSVVVRRSTLERNRTGVSMDLSFPSPGSVVIIDSHLRDNGNGAFNGGGHLSVIGSWLDHNGTAIGCSEADCQVARSRFSDNGFAVGAFVFGVRLTDNRFAGNKVGYAASGHTLSGHIQGNNFRRNGTAVSLRDSATDVIANTFTENGTGINSDTPTDLGVLMKDNTLTRNGDGILATGPLNSLRGNVSVDNARWGIYAPAAIDLGGNVAHGNGTSPQCLGVACR